MVGFTPIAEQQKIEVAPESFWGVAPTNEKDYVVVPGEDISFTVADTVYMNRGMHGIPAVNFGTFKDRGQGDWSFTFDGYPDIVGMYAYAMLGVQNSADSVTDGNPIPFIEFLPAKQKVFVDATAGKFKLVYTNSSGNGEETADLEHNASAKQVKTALEGLSSIFEVGVTGTGSFENPWTITFLKTDYTHTDAATLKSSGSKYDVTDLSVKNAATALTGKTAAGYVETVVRGRQGPPSTPPTGGNPDMRKYLHRFSLFAGATDPAGKPQRIISPSITHRYGDGVTPRVYAGSIINTLGLSWDSNEGALRCSVAGTSKRPVNGNLLLGPNDDTTIGAQPAMAWTAEVYRGGQFEPAKVISAEHNFERELGIVNTSNASANLGPSEIRGGGLDVSGSIVLNYKEEQDYKDYIDGTEETFEVRLYAPNWSGDQVRMFFNKTTYMGSEPDIDTGSTNITLGLGLTHSYYYNSATDYGPARIEVVSGRSSKY